MEKSGWAKYDEGVKAQLPRTSNLLRNGTLAMQVSIRQECHLVFLPYSLNIGFLVSGLDFGVAAVSMEQRVFNVWIGNEFGPVSSLLSLLAMLAGFIMLLLYIKKRYGNLRVHTGLLRPTLLES